MRRIIHTFILAFQFIILPVVFTACKDDGSNISPLQEATPAFSWEENSFLLETDNGWGITRFSTVLHLATLVKNASTTSHGTVVPVREKRQAVS